MTLDICLSTVLNSVQCYRTIHFIHKFIIKCLLKQKLRLFSFYWRLLCQIMIIVIVQYSNTMIFFIIIPWECHTVAAWCVVEAQFEDQLKQVLSLECEGSLFWSDPLNWSSPEQGSHAAYCRLPWSQHCVTESLGVAPSVGSLTSLIETNLRPAFKPKNSLLVL